MTYVTHDNELDNLQHMLDPMNPLDFLHSDLRYDWLLVSVRYWRCDVAF